MPPVGFETAVSVSEGATEPPLRPRGHRNQLLKYICIVNEGGKKNSSVYQLQWSSLFHRYTVSSPSKNKKE
jgi:hypothetical protein